MITELGIVAGEIWHFLDEHGASRLSTIVSSLDKSRDTILMSLGWLAREGHVILDQQEEDYSIELRK
ncbi:MAG: winged helix-turn-helix domain-containing protein [Candidatus Omnitrophica bacterium]|nr:winged helix-turn-helix domain-containing protein [Candidatus Omnitrophota bacterium]